MSVDKRKIYFVHSAFHLPPAVAQTFKEVEPTYGLVTDESTGVTEVQITGETNVYEKIQAANVGMDIQEIVTKYTDGNGVLNLPQIDTQYGDVSDMPKSMLEAHMKLNKLRQEFEKTSLDIRQKFDFDFGKYLASLDDNGRATKETLDIVNAPVIKKAKIDSDKLAATEKIKAQVRKEIAAEIAQNEKGTK